MKQFIFTLIFIFSLPVTLKAYHFKSYQVEDGLSHNSVWTVMQDKKGFMWFGTNDGLNRFDGRTFKIYKKQPGDSLSIGNNFIHCLKEDSKDRFWVGTKQGLYLFNADNETFTRIKLSSEREPPVSVNSVMEDPDGNIWVACNGFGLYILNPDLTIKKHYTQNNEEQGLPCNFIWSIAKDYYGNIWLGTVGKGLVHFDAQKEVFTQLFKNKELGITDPTIYSLHCDIDNNLWIGTSASGLIRYNHRTEKVSHYMPHVSNIKSIIEYSDHELIMGSDMGLAIFDRTRETFHLNNSESSFDNLTDNSIFSITRDREGSFWIGTYFGGVNYYSPAINKFLYCYNSPVNSSKKNIISSFAENENGDIWIGTHNDGLYLFNPKTLEFKQPYKLGYHDVQALLLDNNKLYLSLYGKGINILNANKGTINSTNRIIDLKSLGGNSITFMLKTSKGDVLFTSEGGVSRLMPSGNLETLEYLKGTPIKDIAEDYNGALWFATHSRGLLRLTSDGKWESFSNNPDDPNSIPGNNVNCIFQDSKFRMWIGTEGEGLATFNQQTNKFEHILNEKNGLPSNMVYSILDDTEGNLWITTGRGLVKIDVNLKSVKTFGYLSDMQRIQFNLNCAMRASDNRLYFGGTNGFMTFNPKEITTNQHKPEIVITGFQIFNKEIKPNGSSILTKSISGTKKITLEHNQSTFSFDFVALSYLSPAQNKYAYKLEGFDKDWNYTTHENKASYMNIPPGKYIFKVKGANNDGIWSDSESTIEIKIKPPFWLSNIMIILYILLAAGAIAYIMYSYEKRLKNTNQEKLYKYKTAKEKEMYESKINFFTTIAHEIRTPLSLIVAPLEKIVSSGDGNPQTKNNLGIIERNANRLMELVNQLLDFRKIEEDMFHFNFRKQNMARIIQKVYNQYYQSTKLSGIDMSLTIEDPNIQCNVDSESIHKIMSNLMNNARKYTQSIIDIQVKMDDNNNLNISVTDNGPGIEEQYINQIFEPFFQVQLKDNVKRTGSGLGLSLSQSLAAKHGGNISVESNFGKGCTFTLTLPNAEHVESDEEIIITQAEEPIQIENTATENNLKILVVEDNEELRTFIVDSLKENYAVLQAENGIKALDIVENDNIDLVISDIIMPEMDGLELCNSLKNNPAYSHLPIILLSAKTDTPTKVEGLTKGADVYMEKPFSVEQLKAQINSIIENRNHLRENFIKSPLQFYKQNTNVENNENAEFIEQLNTFITENMSDEKFSIDNLSKQFYMSRSNLHKKIKNITGMTPNDYIKLIRLNKSAQMLSTGKYKINEVCYLVGFNTPSYFSKCFFEHFGKLPKDFIANE